MSNYNIIDFSNPSKVQKLANKYLGKDVDIYLSTRKNKKYMVLNPETNKFVHFGDKRYADFTHHQDEKRRIAFQKRNAKWKDAPKWSSSYLAYYLLW